MNDFHQKMSKPFWVDAQSTNCKMAGLKIEPEEGPKADFDIGAAMKKRFRPPDSQVIEEADEEEGELDTEDRTVYEFMKNYMEYEEQKQ